MKNQIVNAGEVEGVWECPDCGHKKLRTYEDTAEAFEPYCEKVFDMGDICDAIMEFADEQPTYKLIKAVKI